MCRLFGFRSIIDSQVHRSLVTAENAIGVQSRQHPDGWGVAYYVGGAPHLIKSADQAMTDQIFQRVSGVVASETVVAHIRRATQGARTALNAHPFQHGRWVFAHNGNLRGFAGHRAELLDRVAPGFRRFILGETDSEVLFYLLLTHIAKCACVYRERPGFDDVSCAARAMVAEVTAIVGPCSAVPDGPSHDTYLSFVVTDGDLLLAHQGGKPLFYSTHKTRCADRASCASFSPVCEQPVGSGAVHHLLVSSEPLHGENVWTPLHPGDVVGVDAQMSLFRSYAGAASGLAAVS